MDKEKMSSKENLYKGKQFVITGAGNGIGKAIVDLVITEGAGVMGIDYSKDFTGEGKYQLDIRNKNELDHFADQLTKTQKKIDYLILSAGITQSEVGDNPQNALDINAINNQGTKNSFEAIAPALQDSATVVFLSSDMINDPTTRLPIYAQSKRAIADYATEVNLNYPHLRVLTLLPGPVMTNLFTTNKPPQVIEAIDKEVGIMDTGEFAKVVLHDIIPNNKEYPTGSQIVIYKNRVEKAQLVNRRNYS